MNSLRFRTNRPHLAKRGGAQRTAALVAAAMTLTCGLVEAQPAGSVSTLEQRPAAENDGHRLQWNYPRARVWQYVAIGLQSATNVYFEVGNLPSPGQSWRTPLPLDLGIRRGIRADTQRGRENADLVSDVLWHSVQYYPVVVDGLLVPLVFDDLNTDVAWQMTVINWQTLGLTGIVSRIGHHTVPRARPNIYGCSEDPNADYPCPPGSGSGFPSGHVAMTTAGASLSCIHHWALPLYGEGPGGGITCATLTAGAITVGLMRMAADKHWFTDVLMGHVIGASLGFGMPYLLHYQDPITPDVSALGMTGVAWLPAPVEGGAMMSVIGAM